MLVFVAPRGAGCSSAEINNDVDRGRPRVRNSDTEIYSVFCVRLIIFFSS